MSRVKDSQNGEKCSENFEGKTRLANSLKNRDPRGSQMKFVST